MSAPSFSLEVVVHGRALRVVNFEGAQYVVVPDEYVGQQAEFLIRISPSHSTGRYEAAVGVDGRDVISGVAASKNARGYVFRGSLELEGWRLTRTVVAKFKFVPPEASYAARQGASANVGVIAVAVYDEAFVERGISREASLGLGSESVTRGGGSWQTKGGHDVGVGFGGRTPSRVGSTEFERGSLVAELRFEYASETSLRERGILKDSPLGEVSGFPADETGFCTPPAGWRG